MDSVQLAVGTAVFLGASMLQGVAGFGMGLVGVPFLLMVYPTPTVTAMMALYGCVADLVVFWSLRRSVNWRLLTLLVVGAVLGVGPGAWAARVLPMATFKTIVGAVVVACGVALATGWKLHRTGDGLTVLAGVLAGVLGGAVSIPGAAVSIFLTASAVSRDAFRATISLFFVVVNILVITALSVGGSLTFGLVTMAPLYVGEILLGTWLGVKLGTRVPQVLFRRVVVGLIVFSGLSLIVLA